MVMNAQEFKSFYGDADTYEYPGEQIAEHGGIPQNTVYDYVSSTFLNGLVNYLDKRRYFMINRYGLDDGRQIFERSDYEAAASELSSSVHTDLLTHDDCLVFGESSTSVWFLWFDNDTSDCCIERFDKNEIDLDNFIEHRLARIVATYDDWKHTLDPEPIIVEFEARGWVRA